jgi:hypothetical protein
LDVRQEMEQHFWGLVSLLLCPSNLCLGAGSATSYLSIIKDFVIQRSFLSSWVTHFNICTILKIHAIISLVFVYCWSDLVCVCVYIYILRPSIQLRSQDNSVGGMTRLWAGLPSNCDSVPGRGKGYSIQSVIVMWGTNMEMKTKSLLTFAQFLKSLGNTCPFGSVPHDPTGISRPHTLHHVAWCSDWLPSTLHKKRNRV